MVLNIISHQKVKKLKSQWNIIPYSGINEKNLVTPIIVHDVEQVEFLHVIGGKIKYYSFFGKQAVSYKLNHIPTCNPQIPHHLVLTPENCKHTSVERFVLEYI
jgi:hypothetical protein